MTTFPTADADLAADLRRGFAGWTVDTVEELLGERASRALRREQVIPARLAARTHGSEPAAVLTRLFMLGDAVPRRQAEAALEGISGAERAGLVVTAGAGGEDEVRATVDLRPYAATAEDGQHDWWIASDPGEAATHRGLQGDHVLGIGGASRTLASITMRRPCERVLDLGTGCGIQALHASLHSRRVVATDISARALGYARFNEALNAAALAPEHQGWDLREGSMLEPVTSEAFDLVVSNPPFVISPEGTPQFEYRAAGWAGDAVVEQLVSTVGSVLNPGGVAQLLGNWEIHGDWSARLEQWLDASAVPLDAWVVQRDVLDAAEYAETWLRDAGLTPDRDAAAYADAYEAYLRGFDARGVEGVGLGFVVLRRPLTDAAAPIRRLEEHEGPVAMPLGPHIGAVLEVEEWLRAASDAEILDTAVTVAPDVTKETHGRPLLHEPEHLLLRQGGGFGRAVKADTALAGLVGACDGELTVGQIAHALAALLDVPSGQMIAGLVPAVRELLRDGFLLR